MEDGDRQEIVELRKDELKLVAKTIDTNTVQSKEKEAPKKKRFLEAGLSDSEDETVILKKENGKVKVKESQVAGRSLLMAILARKYLQFEELQIC